MHSEKSLNFGNLGGCGFDILICVEKARPQINTRCVIDHRSMTDIAAPWRIMLVASTA